MESKILIVDDSPSVRMIIRNVLTSAGYAQIREAATGQEAFEIYHAWRPDLVTLDIVMPKMDGVNALERILEYDNKARVIMVTAVDQKELLMKTIRLGATDYIVKPFDDARILGAVHAALQIE